MRLPLIFAPFLLPLVAVAAFMPARDRPLGVNRNYQDDKYNHEPDEAAPYLKGGKQR
jgi:hypothetical protein